MPRRRNDEPIEGFPPPCHVSFTGTGTDLDGFEPVIGQDVEVILKGTVTMVGVESVGDAGETRPVAKIKAGMVTVR